MMHMKRLFYILLLLWPLSLFAETEPLATDSVERAYLYQPTQYDLNLLDWALEWLDTTSCTNRRDTTPLSEEQYKKRLSAMPCLIEMPYNSIVGSFIDRYVNKNPRQVAALNRLGEFYFPIFEDRLSAYGLPTELKYLPVIESALNASARSRAGAAGLWQFMPSTAKTYGLEVNSLIDERLDPYKSTDAACRMLKSLYRIFEDWSLAIAAYNCGPGNVNKALMRAGGHGDFWQIYPYLPAETRAYVPIFIAANYAMYYSDAHGICPSELHDGVKLKHRDQLLPMRTDTVHLTERMHLVQVAEVLQVPLEELKKLNPQYIHNIIPGGKPYSLVLPMEAMGPFIHYKTDILAYKADSLIAQRQEVSVAGVSSSSAPKGNNGVVYYKIQKGDTLAAIAKKYHCSISSLQKWNNLKSTTIQAGRTLKIYK